jgi:hypothetical protein
MTAMDLGLDEFELRADAKQLLRRAKENGASCLSIPWWMLASLIEQAERPHD